MAADGPDIDLKEEGTSDISRDALLLLIACIIGLISNWVGHGITPLDALAGMAILYATSVGGLALARYVGLGLPSVAWVSLIAILLTIPGVPGSAYVVGAVGKLDFLSLATPALAYGGLALTSKEFAIARSSGWKIVLVAICVMLGTYLGSAVIAQLVLSITG
ncbi:hypothetical protein J1C48_08100 [Jiella sp. CQZ9-1]|uniref:DUF340 domain-containing protein n=1 Tax=Jiella flava TaxID=2816857 RepID=A0A939G011_9HYPH|nr:hypothetical protein [Jiella flava]